MASRSLAAQVRNEQKQLLAFFGITFAVSWLLWLLPVLKTNVAPGFPDIVGLPGMFAPFGPAIAAFWLTWRRSGRSGARELWSRGWRIDFERRWLGPTLLLGPLAVALTVAIVLLIGQPIDWEVGVPPLMIGPIFLLIYFTNALPEEYGWRGYALDPLQRSTTPLVASLVLGAVWALWHLPLFFIDGTTQQAIPMYQFLLQQMVLAILYTYLHNKTGGSVLIAALFHASMNTSAAAVPYWTTEIGRWIGFLVLLAFALVVVWRWSIPATHRFRRHHQV